MAERLRYLPSNLLKVGVAISIPSGGNFFLLILKLLDVNFCTKMAKMSDLCYLRKFGKS